MNTHFPPSTGTSVFAGWVGVTLSPSFLPVWFSGTNSRTSFGNSFPLVPDLNSWVTLYSVGFGSSSFVNTHVPTTCSSAPLIVAVSLSHASNVQVPLFSSSFTGVKSFGESTFVPSASFSCAFGSWSNTSCGSLSGVPFASDGLNS